MKKKGGQQNHLLTESFMDKQEKNRVDKPTTPAIRQNDILYLTKEKKSCSV